MPCDSSYLEPTDYEEESIRVLECLSYALEITSKDVPQWVKEGASNCYGDTDRLDKAVVMLCDVCTNMDEDLIYNGRNPKARKVADWWDEHKKADEIRIMKEERDAEEKRVKEKAKSKLSQKELEALGLLIHTNYER